MLSPNVFVDTSFPPNGKYPQITLLHGRISLKPSILVVYCT